MRSNTYGSNAQMQVSCVAEETLVISGKAIAIRNRNDGWKFVLVLVDPIRNCISVERFVTLLSRKP